MITTPQQQHGAIYRPVNTASIVGRAIAAVRWPFTNRLAAPIWLLLRLYIGWIFVQMAISKFEAGFLTSDPIGEMLKLVANGTIPVPLEFYRGVAGMLVSLGATPMISHTMPFLELAVALSLFTGVLTPAAAVGAILLNVNFVLSGIGSIAFDGPIIAAEILMVLGYRVVGVIGFEKLALRILNAIVRAVRPARPAQPAPARPAMRMSLRRR